jgi:hypothetical protein
VWDLLLEFTSLSLADPNAAAAMFDDDGAFEMPYIADFLKSKLRMRVDISPNRSDLRK